MTLSIRERDVARRLGSYRTSLDPLAWKHQTNGETIYLIMQTIKAKNVAPSIRAAEIIMPV